MERTGWLVAPWTLQVEWLFVIGCPRSGTTWLQALLGSHPEIHTAPETHFFHAFAGADRSFRTSMERNVGPAAYHTPEAFYALMADLFRHTLSQLPAPPRPPRYFLDKAPHYAMHADFILRVFPRARFIHMVRDARGTVPSLLRAAATWGRLWAPRNLDEACAYWSRFVRAGQAVRGMVGDPGQYQEVRYEDLRRDPARELTRLLGGLGLAAEPGLLAEGIARNDLAGARHRGLDGIAPSPRDLQQTGAPDYPQGFFGSGAADPAARLPRWARRRVEHLAGPLLRELGYRDVGSPLSPVGRALTCPAVRRFTPPAA